MSDKSKDVVAEAFSMDEIIHLTNPKHGWGIGTVECILNALRKNGRCYVHVQHDQDYGFDNVPTVAEMLYPVKRSC